ncbi:MAG TPA: hypothetical protein VM911_06000 [Pyrinomonadaceae bacterium]|jgi:hypothetical protein|nr:hypothetical protein [Pyrinomonadaceae bacterium]
MNKYFISFVASVLLIGCESADAVRVSNSAVSSAYTSPSPQLQLSEINLAQIGRIAPKGRVQDRDYNQLPVVEQLIAHGKEAIPFLISKLDDETKIEGQIMDHWNQVYVGDVALIVLSDFALNRSWERSTIEGMKWDEFLGRGNNREITGERLLRNYIEKYGRKRIKERWQNVWEKYRERIYWDEQERAFKVRK